MDRLNSDYGEPLEPYKSPSDVTAAYQNPMDNTETRTTLTGQPIPAERYHDHYTNMMDGAGFGIGNAGANTLPPGYTDKSLVRIPIRESDLEPEGQEPEPESSEMYSPEVQVTKKGVFGGLFKGLKTKTTSSRQRNREGGFQMVMMSRKDYLSYWAKGDDGKFLPNVVDPPGGRRAWLKQQLELNEEWVREDPSLAEGGSKSKANKKM